MPEKITSYQLMQDVLRAVNRIEDKLDDRLTELDHKIDKRFVDVEKDVSELKKFQNKAIGVLAILGIGFQLAINWAWEKITK